MCLNPDLLKRPMLKESAKYHELVDGKHPASPLAALTELVCFTELVRSHQVLPPVEELEVSSRLSEPPSAAKALFVDPDAIAAQPAGSTLAAHGLAAVQPEDTAGEPETAPAAAKWGTAAAVADESGWGEDEDGGGVWTLLFAQEFSYCRASLPFSPSDCVLQVRLVSACL